MAAMNEEAIQMAVDYLLSADGTSPIEVQLSFLKSRMKMAPQEIAEALRLTGLDGSEAMSPQPATSATIVDEAEQAQRATHEPTAADVKIAEVTTEPPRATTQPQALSTQSATHGYMANAFPQQPSLVVGYRGSHGRAPLSAPHPTVDTRHFTKPITGAPAPERVVVTSVGGAPPVKHAQARNFQPQFTVGTSSRASMNNSRKSSQWTDDGKNAVGAIMGLGSAFDEGGKENGAGVANKRRPASGRRAGQAYGSWTKNELRSSMNLGNAGSGARRKTASQNMHETAPMDSGSYSGSGGYGRQGKFSQEQSLFRPRPDLVQYNNLGQYHESGMDPAANCITNGEGYATSWSARGLPTKISAPADAEYKGWHHEAPVHKPAPTISDSDGGWFNDSTADAAKGRGQRAGRPKSTWQDQNKGGDAMTGILGGGGGMSWGLGKTGDVKAHLPSIANSTGAGASPPGGGYSLVSANRSARLAGNSPRDLAPSAMYKPSQMDPRDFQQIGRASYQYKEPEKVTGYVAQYIS